MQKDNSAAFCLNDIFFEHETILFGSQLISVVSWFLKPKKNWYCLTCQIKAKFDMKTSTMFYVNPYCRMGSTKLVFFTIFKSYGAVAISPKKQLFQWFHKNTRENQFDFLELVIKNFFKICNKKTLTRFWIKNANAR
jgi:hypothetical protein